MKHVDPNAIYTVEEVAAIFGAKPAAVRAWTRAGRLPALRPGRRYYYSGAALLGFQPSAAPAPTTDRAREIAQRLKKSRNTS